MSQFSFGPANEQIPNATTSASGLMSATDKTKLDGISQSTMRDVPFAVAVADWTLSSGVYSAEFTSAYITASSKEIATYEANYRDYAKASISIDKKSGGGGMIFTTSVIPTGTITGHLYVWDNDDSKVPVLIEDTVVGLANGGTGQSSLAGVKSAFGIDALNTQITKLNNDINITAHGATAWTAVGVTVINGTYSSIDSGGISCRYDDNYVFIQGTLRVRGFTRTGSNPGVQIALPVDVNPKSSALYATGFISNLNSSEYLTMTVNSHDKNLRITTSENLTNASNGIWVITIPHLLIERYIS